MKTNKRKTSKEGSDTDKAIAQAGKASVKPGKNVTPAGISLDAVIAEKDEVKNAEERMRRQLSNRNDKK